MTEKVGILGLVKVGILGGVNWGFLFRLNLFLFGRLFLEGVFFWVRCVGEGLLGGFLHFVFCCRFRGFGVYFGVLFIFI